MADAAGRSAPEGAPPLIAVLEGLNDHENIGALFRNAAAFGVGGVLLDPTCADPLYRRSIRVSVGHVLHMPFARLVPWPSGSTRYGRPASSSLRWRRCPATDGGLPVMRLAELKAWMSGPDRPVGVALLLGAEGPGLTDAALAASNVVVPIPTVDRVDR